MHTHNINANNKKSSFATDEEPKSTADDESHTSDTSINTSRQHSFIVISDWSTIYDSKALVKTKEGLPCGNIVDEYNDSIVLIDFGGSSSQEYLVPKSTVEGYDGKFLYLNIQHEILTTYGY
jgi:hypothetical protein